MSTAKHTPGPWRVAPAKGTLCAWRIESEIGQCVAFVAQTIGNNQLENDRAKLIAAAPALLEACKTALVVLKADSDSERDNAAEIAQLETALKQAEL